MNNPGCRYRITYEKVGSAAYIGHLDLQRVFQRAFRLSGLKPRYSQGFNPHPLLSFAMPLSVGMEGLKEMADIWLTENRPAGSICGPLTAALPQGLTCTGCEALAPECKAAAALVKAAAYEIKLCYNIDETGKQPDFAAAANDIMASDSLMANELRPGKSKEAKNLRRFIRELSAEGNRVYAVLDCGGSGGARPQEVAAALCGAAEAVFDGLNTEYTRLELIF